ncbi:MAG: hypothetical protein CVU39_24810 [Chloroflexi bacterium HGW-Chloroflexi-10]|nr:MAG: hypothetical protein CVU39_24810 [Chloroflexi bacterium HGW-Chloroflexi-10]
MREMSEVNGVLIASFVIAGAFNVIFPFILGWWIIRKKHTSWKLIGVGVLTFIGSQIVHLPLVSGLTWAFSSGLLPHLDPAVAPYFNAVVLGLLAGLCEETARWIGYKVLKKKGDSFGSALTLGVGHGGVEAVIIGALVLLGLVSNLTLNAMFASGANPGIPAEQLEATKQALTAYFANPWHLPLVGAVERIGAVSLHISLSIMVWLAISARKPLWFWGAVLYHAAVDGLVVLAGSFGMNMWLLEVIFIIVSFAGLFLMLRAGKQWEAQRLVSEEELPVEAPLAPEQL